MDNPDIIRYARFAARVRHFVRIRDDDGDGSIGAGVCLTDDGLILTAAHVVEGCEQVTVETCLLTRDTRRLHRTGQALAQVMYSHRRADIAVLGLCEIVPRLTPAPWTNRPLAIGRPVFRLGSDDAQLAEGYTFRRQWRRGFPEVWAGMPAAERASGGPVFHCDTGELVGIVYMVQSDASFPGAAVIRPLPDILNLLRRQPWLAERLPAT